MPPVPEPLCVVCQRRPVDPALQPFCSDRCRLVDLARWADGTYRIAGEPVDPDAIPDEDRPDRS